MAKRSKKTQGYVNPIVEPPDAPVAKNVGKPKGGSGAADKAKAKQDAENEKIQNSIRRLLNEAMDFYEEELEPDQTKATNYYYGRPFGDEKDGRSKVVNTVVRDAVLAAIPSLMRIVYESDGVVEYVPRPKGLEALPVLEANAKQATDYVRYIVTEDNPGFQIFWSWIMDGLVRRLGVVKWWWEDVTTKTRSDYTGLTEQERDTLASDDEVEIEKVESYEVSIMGQPVTLYDVSAYHTEKDGIVKIECVPSEEWFVTPNARSLEDALLVAHVRELPSDDVEALLVADGMSPDDAELLVEENKGKRRRIVSDDLAAARQFDGINRRELNPEQNEVEDVVLYGEVYAKIEVDDPNYPDDEALFPERRLFKVVGPQFEITNGDGKGECVDDLPFSAWTPIPEPHTIVGLSFWDLLRDIQRIISQIERGTLDSLAQAITPVTEVVNGMVNMQDFINPEVAGLRRVRAIGQTQTIAHHFVGGDTLPMLDYYGSVIEDRTGKNKGAMGLDADALQSTTKVAAASILSASQQRVEIIARVFAETGLKPLFRGLLKLITKHQSQARLVRLRNQYVQVDPRQWDATMDVQVNVALGAGTPSDRIEVLSGIASKQQELMQTGSPLVSNVELRRTLAKISELSGYKDSDAFFKPWGQNEEAQMQQALAQQPPPPPSADVALVEVERQKAAAKAAIDLQDMQLKQWEAQKADERERQKMANDFLIADKELELKYAQGVHQTETNAQVKRDQMQTQITAGAPA